MTYLGSYAWKCNGESCWGAMESPRGKRGVGILGVELKEPVGSSTWCSEDFLDVATQVLWAGAASECRSPREKGRALRAKQ